MEHIGRALGFSTGDGPISMYAERHGLVIATQDADFILRARADLRHAKVIFLKIGNRPGREQAACFERNRDAIEAFVADPGAIVLEIE